MGDASWEVGVGYRSALGLGGPRWGSESGIEVGVSDGGADSEPKVCLEWGLESRSGPVLTGGRSPSGW